MYFHQKHELLMLDWAPDKPLHFSILTYCFTVDFEHICDTSEI